MKIYLKYGIYSSGTLTMYPSTGSQAFNAISNLVIPNADRVKGRSLSQYEYNHLISHRNNRKIVISADELAGNGNTQFTWLQAFFQQANYWSYSPDGTTFTEVTLLEQGDMPITWVENSKYMPEITMTLIQTAAS